MALTGAGAFYLVGLMSKATAEMWWVATPSLNPWISGTWMLPAFYRQDQVVLGVCLSALLLRGISLWALMREPTDSMSINGPWLAGLSAPLLLASAALAFVFMFDGRFSGRNQEVMYMSLAIPDVAIACLIASRFRSMARRIPAPRLSRLLAIAQIGTAAGVFIFVLGFFLFWRGPCEITRSWAC